MKKMTGATTKLEKRVQGIINYYASDYDNSNSGRGVENWLSDLFRYGCVSGMVGSLIYYTDTIRFYKRYRAEIESLLVEIMRDYGKTSLIDVVRDFDTDDPFARDTQNQNLLAWFGFEETARRLADRAGLEI